jgi:ubiquitin carboxyl-terminal hydrolase 25
MALSWSYSQHVYLGYVTSKVFLRVAYDCIDLLAFAYLAQCRCDPANTIEYFTQLSNIVLAMQELGEAPPPELQALVMEERSRNRFTFGDVHNAAKMLGFGRDGHLGVEFEDDVEEEFIVNAWKDAVRRSWRDAENGASLLRDVHEAFRILAEVRGSVKLHQAWEAGNTKMMTPERAYDALEVPKDVDEALLLTVFNLRVRLLFFKVILKVDYIALPRSGTRTTKSD